MKYEDFHTDRDAFEKLMDHIYQQDPDRLEDRLFEMYYQWHKGSHREAFFLAAFEVMNLIEYHADRLDLDHGDKKLTPRVKKAVVERLRRGQG